jgi:acyl-CoA reductase-like NAD-dependent aldehyde dehydrogenase
MSGWTMPPKSSSGASGKAGRYPAAAQFETHVATGEIYEAATLPSRPYGELIPREQPRLSFAERVPAGVVGVIAPFNFPQILAIRSVAPALALGNAVVLKPDPRAGRSRPAPGTAISPHWRAHSNRAASIA